MTKANETAAKKTAETSDKKKTEKPAAKKTAAKKESVPVKKKELSIEELTMKKIESAKNNVFLAVEDLESLIDARRKAGKPAGRYAKIMKNLRFIANRRI